MFWEVVDVVAIKLVGGLPIFDGFLTLAGLCLDKSGVSDGGCPKFSEIEADLAARQVTEVVVLTAGLRSAEDVVGVDFWVCCSLQIHSL